MSIPQLCWLGLLLGFFLLAASRSHSLVAEGRLLFAVAYLVVEHGV